jgi:hypothetical protein
MRPKNIAKKVECRLCGKEAVHFSSAAILTYVAEYFECVNCGSVQVDNPFWIELAHSKAISCLDTGLVSRCLSASRLIGTFLFLENQSGQKGIDWGGGTGLLTRLLRDQGYETQSFDSYADGTISEGFNATRAEVLQPATFLCAIECFEHLENPLREFTSATLGKEYFIFTTELIDSPPPNPANCEWWYYMPEAGQHITFATELGLKIFTQKLGFSNYFRFGSLHVMSRKEIRLRTRLIMSARLLRSAAILLIPEFLNRRFSLTWKDKEYLTKLM